MRKWKPLLAVTLLAALSCRADWESDSMGFVPSDSANVSIPTVSGGGDKGDDDDWLILTSGEMLKGEIKGMYGGELQFDSDKLGDLSIDWDDIKEIRTSKTMSLRLNRRQTVSGTVTFNGEEIAVEEAGGDTVTVHKDNVVAMVQKHKSEIKNWSFEVGAGVNIQRGNTNETSYSSNVNITRETALTRFNISYLGNYTRTNGTTTTSNQMANSYFDYYLDKKIFIRPAFIQYYRDPFQNLDFQGTAGAGIGYQIYEGSKLEWDAVAGPAFLYTEYQSVPPGGDKTVSSPAALVSTSYSYDITGDLTLKGVYRVIFANKQSGLINGNFNTTLTYELTDLLDINTSVVWNYIAFPAKDSTGATPSPSDLYFIFGIGLSY